MEAYLFKKNRNKNKNKIPSFWERMSPSFILDFVATVVGGIGCDP